MSVSPGVMMASKPHPPLAQEVIRGRPRGHQIRGPPRDQAAQIHVERQEGFSVFCLIQCIPFALCWVCHSVLLHAYDIILNLLVF